MPALSRLERFTLAYGLLASLSTAILALGGAEGWDAYTISSLALYMVTYSVYRPGGGLAVRIVTSIVGAVLAALLLARILRVIA